MQSRCHSSECKDFHIDIHEFARSFLQRLGFSILAYLNDDPHQHLLHQVILHAQTGYDCIPTKMPRVAIVILALQEMDDMIVRQVRGLRDTKKLTHGGYNCNIVSYSAWSQRPRSGMWG